MNRCKGFSKVWFLALLLVVFVAGCGSDSSAPAASSSAKSITAYSLNGTSGTITGQAIAVTVPNGTNVTALVATFTTAGASVKVGAVTQVSGTTANNFTAPVVYTVTAADGTTETYTVTVTVASASAKAITAYSLAGATGTITGTAIAVTVPNGTNVTALVATFTTTGASVKVGAVTQVSGTTANNFTAPVVYTVTAADNTTANYTVTVTVAPGSAKALTAFSLNGIAGTITGTAIAVAMPNGTNVTALVATFTTTGASVKVGAVTQVSGTTANNFSAPVVYTVTAADTTTATYTVTVTVAALPAGPPAVALGTAGTFAILANTGISTVPTSTVTGNIGVNDVASLITGFSLTAPSTFSTSTQVIGQVFAADYAAPTPGNLITAADDMLIAFTDAAGRTATSAATTNVGGGTLTGLTLTPATYVWGSAVTIPTDLTLVGGPNDVWIFVITGTLDMAAAKNIILSGGAQAKNIFWAVSDVVTIGANAHFEGIILGQTLIALQNGASINGRLLAQSAVTLIANTVTQK